LKSQGLIETNNFFVGFSIQQISKQFDLLRIGKDSIVNIELKRISTPEKIETQLRQNQYYLSFLSLPVHTFTYVSQTNALYSLDNDQNLESADFQALIDTLHQQEHFEVPDIHSLFKPSNYLVSPFNSTAKFINNEYFLTENQNNIKKRIFETFNSSTHEFVSITGKPGTGKTLMTYDIAKDKMTSGLNVAIVHCGNLNNGHFDLIQNHSWSIHPIKRFNSSLAEDVDILIFDEAQRLRVGQISEIEEAVVQNNVKCIFSFDPDQCLTHEESRRNIGQLIKELTVNKNHKLTEKIRTNKEISSFIKTLFDLNKINPNQDYKNISVQYFKNNDSAKEYAIELSDSEWEVINFSNSLHYHVSYDNIQPSGNKTSHAVIGQEFDKVAVFIDSHFYYNEMKKLEAYSVSRGVYAMDKMLYQNLTRTRTQLQLIVVGNHSMLSTILDILDPKVPVTV